MTAILVSVAEAVKDELKAGMDAGDFILTFEPERSYADWDLELKDEDAQLVLVDVVPVSQERIVDIDDRGDVEHIIPIDVGIRRKFTQSELDNNNGRVLVEEVDTLLELVEQIANRTALARLPTFTEAVYDPENPPSVVDFSRHHLRAFHMFFGRVRLTYRVSQSL